jgi:hypothetical protein
MITVYINIGKIVEALERAGIEPRVPDDDEELNSLFIPTGFREIQDDGSAVEIRGGNLNEHAKRSVSSSCHWMGSSVVSPS